MFSSFYFLFNLLNLISQKKYKKYCFGTLIFSTISLLPASHIFLFLGMCRNFLIGWCGGLVSKTCPITMTNYHVLLQGITLTRDQTCLSCIAGRFFTSEPPGKCLIGCWTLYLLHCWKSRIYFFFLENKPDFCSRIQFNYSQVDFSLDLFLRIAIVSVKHMFFWRKFRLLIINNITILLLAWIN